MNIVMLQKGGKWDWFVERKPFDPAPFGPFSCSTEARVFCAAIGRSHSVECPACNDQVADEIREAAEICL